MTRVTSAIQEVLASGRKGVIPFICAGFPRPDSTVRTLSALAADNVPVIEVGIPFSDPIADGPVIAGAMHRALQGGVTPERIFSEIQAARGQFRAALVAMVSVSIVHRFGGAAGFARRAREAGFDGLIVPDVPLEESGQLRAAAAEHGLSFTLLVAATTPAPRVAEIARACTGFVYLMTRTGITGTQSGPIDVDARVKVVREATDLPVACGFGVSTSDHVRSVCRVADAAIVGTALVKAMEAGEQRGDDPSSEAGKLLRELASAV
ncbi:MAG: tryptophan synthase subunit alpha [Planctomycetota bacterium]|nr:tryptophan synthase subunit alpha [Planctomycetota bacterium]